MKRILYWFRNDLRLHDNEGFARAVADADDLLPVFIFDPHWFRELPRLGIRKTGIFRTNFLLEAVNDLRQALRDTGADLIVRVGNPAQLLAELAEDTEAQAIYTSKEVTQEETDVESYLSKRLKPLNVDINLFWVSTLYHIHDLPFGIARMPDVFLEFQNQVELYVNVRASVPAPEYIRLVPNVDAGDMPTLATFGFPPQSYFTNQHPNGFFTGGETMAIQWLRQQVLERNNDRIKKSDNPASADMPAKLLAWLALGCLSARYVYQELRQHQHERTEPDTPASWLLSELIQRDFFRFLALRYGTRIFKLGGIRLDLGKQWRRDPDLFRHWCIGQTGIPYVDAHMRELNATGFTSGWGREAVANFLVNDLGIDWTWGAAWFESLLIDYDPCVNWGSWNYIVGVDNDPNLPVYVNFYAQAMRHDPQGTYVKHWIPELNNVPADKIHLIPNLSKAELVQYGVEPGRNYPLPIINPDKWLTPEKDH